MILTVHDFRVLNEHLAKRGPTILEALNVPSHEHDNLIQSAIIQVYNHWHANQKKDFSEPDAFARQTLRNLAFNWLRDCRREKLRSTKVLPEVHSWQMMVQESNRRASREFPLHGRLVKLFETILSSDNSKKAKAVRLCFSLGSYELASRQLLSDEGNYLPTADDIRRRCHRLRKFMTEHYDHVRELRDNYTLLPYLLEASALESRQVSVAAAILNVYNMNWRQLARSWSTQRRRGVPLIDTSNGQPELSGGAQDLLGHDVFTIRRTSPIKRSVTSYLGNLPRERLGRYAGLALEISAESLALARTQCIVAALSNDTDLLTTGHQAFRSALSVYLGSEPGDMMYQADWDYIQGITYVEMGHEARGKGILTRMSNQMLEEFFDTGRVALWADNPPPG